MLFTNEIYSQVSMPDFKYSLTYISTGEVHHTQTPIVTGNEREINRWDSVYARTCIIEISNLSNISKLHVNVGTAKDSTDIFNYSFLYNDSLNLPENVSYISEGNKIYLGLFKTLKTDMYHYKVWLEGLNGELSEPKYFY